MKTKKVSLREIMENDNSPYMKKLEDKFNKLYGTKLDYIIKDSLRTGKPYVDSEKR